MQAFPYLIAVAIVSSLLIPLRVAKDIRPSPPHPVAFYFFGVTVSLLSFSAAAAAVYFSYEAVM